MHAPGNKLSIVTILEKANPNFKVFKHGEFEFYFNKKYPGKFKYAYDFMIKGNSGHFSFSTYGFSTLKSELINLMKEYKKNYVGGNDEWGGYESGYNDDYIKVSYSPSTDLVTITERRSPGSEGTLKCRIDDVPFLLDGLNSLEYSYKKFYASDADVNKWFED